ncbi:hypothetical protein SETIT_2G365500v2 [Setaria italica]|uniref:DUF946 domain-containing protein n=1 Tax=Setaria italica TaxID=4555 RepID=K4A0L2_SETIT|nr:vacuolar protein sorting-associated protein 62 [Setaria italica]RCV13685.1 hypothetical protein SETIT_2G365500v2 [Setaria italica]
MQRSKSCLPCVPMGTAALPIEKHFVPPVALPSWPASVSDGGFAKGSIDLGGLEVRQITTFAKVWSTTQGGEDGVGATFFKPSPVPAGFSVLGHYAQPNSRPLFGHVLVARDTSGTGALLAAPVDYNLVWSSPDGAGHFWLPTAPDGYKAVGAVVTATSDKPSPDEVRCVRADFTDACETEKPELSNSDKDGFSAATLRPAVRGIDARGVHAGTFLAQSSVTPANASSLACLKNNSASYTSAMPDLAQVNSLLAAYAPHVYLHPNESYFPSSATWFFENGALLYQKGSQIPTPVAADGSNLPQGGGNDGGYWLDLPADNKQREKVKKSDLASAKVYVQAKPMLGGTVTDLAVWIFYPFNGPARAKVGFLTIPLGEIGEHVGDWEHVTLRVSNFSGELRRMYFSQHSAGTWVEASQLEYLDAGDGGNRPVAYASRHGHALYPKAGLVLQGDSRLGVGIRNDTSRGSRLDTGGAGRCEVVSAEYLGVAEPAWLGFERGWGPKEEYVIGRVINRVAWILPRSVRERLAKLVEKVFVGDGPTGPKMHGNWRNDEREAR